MIVGGEVFDLKSVVSASGALQFCFPQTAPQVSADGIRYRTED